MKKLLKFICVLVAMLTLASSSFAQKWHEVGEKKASELDLTDADDYLQATSGSNNGTFTVDKTINGADYIKFQFGGSSTDIRKFTFNFTNDSVFEISTLTMAYRPNSAVIDSVGAGTFKLSLATLPSIASKTDGVDVSKLTTTWNFYQTGGLSILKSGITINNTNIVNVAKMNTILNVADDPSTEKVDESTYAGITLNGNAQFNIVDTQTTTTESVKLGNVLASGTSQFTMATTGAGASKINVFKVYDSASTSVEAKNGGWVNVYSTALGGDSSSGLVTAGTANFKSIKWNDATKTAELVYKTEHQGTSFTVGGGVTFTADNADNGLEGGFVFESPTSAIVKAKLYVADNREFSVSGSEGTVQLSKVSITTKTNARLTFNSTNVLRTTTAGSTQKDIDFEIARNGAMMDIFADNDFGSLNLSGSNTKPNIEIALYGNDISFTYITKNSANDTGYVLFTDFVNVDGTENGTITVSHDIAKASDGSLSFVFAGTDLDNKVLLYQWADGSLHTSVYVPEPAHFAMIFGTLALGLVIYRRRK